MYGWRVMVSRDGDNFIRDELKIYMAYRDATGLRVVKPLNFEMGNPCTVDAAVAIDIEPTVIPMALAEELFNHLSFMMIGTSDTYSEIMRLRRDLRNANERVDKLINALT